MISAVVIVKNEEKNIHECLKSLAWCDEIVIIDDHSADKTLEIIKHQTSSLKQKIKIFQRYLNGNFAAQRNFGLQKASGDWVLFVDADERVSPALKDEILKLQTSPVSPVEISTGRTKVKQSGFFLKRTDYFGGRQLKYGETSSVRLLRLARKGSGKWERKVHETWQVKGSVGEMINPLEHYPHRTMTDFLEEVNHYSTLHAEALKNEGKRSSLIKIVFFPFLKFKMNYLFRLGFLDGMPGFTVAFMMSLHSFLAWSKLYLLQKENQ